MIGTIFDDLADEDQSVGEEILNSVESLWGLRDMTIEEAFKIGFAHGIEYSNKKT